MTLWLVGNNIQVYSMHNEGKSFFSEQFIINLRNKFNKDDCFINKYTYINKLPEIVKNNTTILFLLQQK